MSRLFLTLALASAALGCGVSSTASPEVRSGSHVAIHVQPVDLGVIAVGESRSWVGRLRNGPRQVTIDRIETTCDCLHVRLERTALLPHEEQMYRVDLSEDDEFQGLLTIHWTAYADDEAVLQGSVSVEIVLAELLAVLP